MLKRLEVRLVKAVCRWQRSEALRHGATGALTGRGVCFWQWFGSSLQLTPHVHLLVAEALWEEDGTVVPVAPPGDEDVVRILARVRFEPTLGLVEVAPGLGLGASIERAQEAVFAWLEQNRWRPGLSPLAQVLRLSPRLSELAAQGDERR